jgi:hypothetical protein
MVRFRHIVVGLALGASTGCMGMMMSQKQKDAIAQMNQQQMEIVGTLSKGSPGPGMENTGWMFQSNTTAAGGMSVDVSEVKELAEANVGKKVVVKVSGIGGNPDSAIQPAMKVHSIEPVGH